MGCAATKEEDGSGRLVFGGAYNCFHPNKPVLREKEELERQKEEFHDQYQQTLLSRISSYQKESYEYLNDLYLEPKSLLPESLRFGYVSPNAFFNLFHAGFCGPYIANPHYMLLVDFRSKEEHEESRILTSTHYESLSWNMVECPDLCCYSSVVFYDQDGTAAANVLSVLHRAFKALKRRQIEDVFIILGGFSSIESRFPHLILRPPPPPPAPPSPQHLQSSTPNQLSVLGSPSPPIPPSPPPPPLRGLIPWMPTLVGSDRLFLGRHEQAEADAVVFGLGITHVLSIGRSPETRFEGVTYLGLDGERNLLATLEASANIVESVIEKKGHKLLVHGVEGLNRSAAVVMAHLMKSTPCILEDAYFYMQVLRPFIRLDDECMECLLKYEKLLFGSRVTDVDELWM